MFIQSRNYVSSCLEFLKLHQHNTKRRAQGIEFDNLLNRVEEGELEGGVMYSKGGAILISGGCIHPP